MKRQPILIDKTRHQKIEPCIFSVCTSIIFNGHLQSYCMH
jgi:hypothetical protein